MTSVENFGALTTTFTPPSDCSTEKWVQHHNGATLRWGAGCETNTIAWNSSCFPTGLSGAGNNTALAYKGFSPGLACPYGWEVDFSTSSIHRGQGWNPLNAFITSLADDEIATVCCPSGYTFRSLCYSQTTRISESLPLVTVSDGCQTKTVGPFTGKISGTIVSKGTATFQAYPVILVNAASSTGLSTGAKIGIGIGVPAGVLILAALVFIWWHRRRRAQARASEPVAPAVDEPFTGKPELDAGREIAPGVPEAPAELPTVQKYSPQAELATAKSPTTPQAELEGDFGQLSSVKEDGEEGGGTGEVKDQNIPKIAIERPPED